MPEERSRRQALEKIDPWRLRVEGLDRELSLHELGRALFHLAQRRGFRSNRKTDGGADDESGKIKSAAASVRDAMGEAGARTLGEFLARPRLRDPAKQHDHPVRARLVGSGAKAAYEFYPTREMILNEFDRIWASQKYLHGGTLDDAARDELRDILAYQRNLKPQSVGKCALEPDKQRAPRALPTVQRFRIYQEINHLRYRLPGQAEAELTLEQRDLLVQRALGAGQLKFDTIRTALKLPADTHINFESQQRKHLDGDKTGAVMASKKYWGKTWRDLDLDIQTEVIERLLSEEDEERLVSWLAGHHQLTDDTARAVSNAILPDGHGALCRRATEKILAALKDGIVTYDQAVLLAGYASHSQLDFDGEVFDRKLPYYGEVLERHVAFGSGEPADPVEVRLGKIANPTVHVALNQIRHVVNGLIKRFGPPAEIVVEVARDLPLSAQGRRDLEREQKTNREANDLRRAELARLNQRDSYDNRLRLRLWEELNPDDPLGRRCPYTGTQISLQRLFDAEVEVEHILPLSRTLDDSPGNKTLSMLGANRIKGQQTPYEAFSDSPENYVWEDIAARGATLPGNKAWRFGPDAMHRFDNEERDFLARQLTDTRYIARLARTYLLHTGADVWVTPGRLTSDLRWAWGLNSLLAGHNEEEAAAAAKNRDDHRHHVIDAIVIALTDRSLLGRVARAAGQAEERLDNRYLADLAAPWPDFRAHVRDVLENLVVSHKKDHGVQGALHNDTAYGVVEAGEKGGPSLVVHRVPLESLTSAKKVQAIRDDYTREYLLMETDGLSGKDFTTALLAAGKSMQPPLRKVRICETISVNPITDAEGTVYKAYKRDSNYCYDIFSNEKGRWDGVIISSFDANQPGFRPNAKTGRNGQALIMRLRINDMLAIEEDSKRRIMRVVKLSKGKITLAEHFEGGSLKNRDAEDGDPFNYRTLAPSGLRLIRARTVHVDPSGRLFDPGPPS
ncbi:MAG: type II CRISPR RNA-guided endonuclease Cas9 [Rhodospirillaceae bacterium]|nr:type II CRISPR RNA-guided endonuclease Cas9 [Rhodospirillaceae bacterium]